MAKFPKKKGYTEVLMSDESYRNPIEKYSSGKQFIDDLKENVQKNAPELVKGAFESIIGHVNAKKIENEKIIAEKNNIDVDTQNKYSDLELKEIQKFKEVAELRKLELENEEKQMSIVKQRLYNEQLQKFMDCLREKNIMFYVDKDDHFNFFPKELV